MNRTRQGALDEESFLQQKGFDKTVSARIVALFLVGNQVDVPSRCLEIHPRTRTA